MYTTGIKRCHSLVSKFGEIILNDDYRERIKDFFTAPAVMRAQANRFSTSLVTRAWRGETLQCIWLILMNYLYYII
jgi:hypothetical protein